MQIQMAASNLTIWWSSQIFGFKNHIYFTANQEMSNLSKIQHCWEVACCDGHLIITLGLKSSISSATYQLCDLGQVSLHFSEPLFLLLYLPHKAVAKIQKDSTHKLLSTAPGIQFKYGISVAYLTCKHGLQLNMQQILISSAQLQLQYCIAVL